MRLLTFFNRLGQWWIILWSHEGTVWRLSTRFWLHGFGGFSLPEPYQDRKRPKGVVGTVTLKANNRTGPAVTPNSSRTIEQTIPQTLHDFVSSFLVSGKRRIKAEFTWYLATCMVVVHSHCMTFQAERTHLGFVGASPRQVYRN